MKQILTALFLFFTFLSAHAQQTVGLFTQNSGSLDGYVLFAPIRSDTTYLIDKCGKKIHQWSSTRNPGLSVYLLPDGSLLRTGAIPNPTFNGQGSAGGLIEKYDWNNNLVWSYTISSTNEIQNHDIYPLPNGNIIVAIWENFTSTQAIAAGRNPTILGTSLWSAKLEEIQPVGTTSANIVWQWDLWDHLIQDYDSTKSNYGIVTNHPELLNLNYNGTNTATAKDWIHLNAVTYNSALDQVMFSSHNLSEIYIIDHSTTTAQAASHAGGTHGKGGDFLYRWGNPQAYNRGTDADRKLFLQHNPTWIPVGYPDENKIMIFNNGVNRPGGNAASVDIISPPVDSLGDYSIVSGQAFGPATIDWSYMNPIPTSFYTPVMGGAQRLPNGNTIICEATKGNFFEIDSAKNIVWRYVNPVDSTGPISQGTTTSKNEVFRCLFFEPSYSGFTGHTLTPGNPIELNPLPYNCTMITGIDENVLNENSSLTISNPFTNNLFIHANADLKNATVTLLDIAGRIIEKWNSFSINAGENKELTLQSSLADGIYFLNIQNATVYYSTKLVRVNTK